MFWIILKIAVFLLAVAGLTLGAERLLESPAGLRIALANTEFTLGPLQAALAALALLVVLWVLLRLAGLLVALLRFINGDETAISRYFERSRKRRGLEALTEGFLALATGEGETAVAKGRKAEKLLENRTLTNLLMAQAAQAKGNSALAEEYYKLLLADERARFVGIQGLMRQKLDAGDSEKARKLAEKALGLRPGHGATQDTLLALQNQGSDWQGARRTLAEVKRTGRLPKDVYRRRDAVLALQQAASAEQDGQTALAEDLALEANAASPDLIPAAVMAAQAQMSRGKPGAAAKILKKAWKGQPHPELAQAFAALEPEEAPADRVRRFEKLLAQNEGTEAQMIRAELLIAAEDFPAARRSMGDLHATAPSQRVMTIMAAIERGEGSEDAVVRGWLARALIAPRGPQWVCEKCHHIHGSWQALCENCGGFDTLAWRSPPDSSGPSATGTEMLPLIVGALSAPRALHESQALGEVDATTGTETSADDGPTVDEAVESPPPSSPAPAATTAAASDAAGQSKAEPEPDVIDLNQARRSGM